MNDQHIATSIYVHFHLASPDTECLADSFAKKAYNCIFPTHIFKLDVCVTLIRAKKLVKGIYRSKAKFLSHHIDRSCQFS